MKPVPCGPEEIVFEGKHFLVTHQEFQERGKRVTYETARRAPGVRVIIRDGEKMLLTKEHRTEIDGVDYRLPGGKVFDSLKEFVQFRKKDMTAVAREAALRECREEAGIIPGKLELFHISHAGATVEWDLYYFVATNLERTERELGAGEVIEPVWMTVDEAKKLCLSGKMREDRTVGVLLRYLH